MSKSHYAIFHTTFLLKKTFQSEQVFLIIILPFAGTNKHAILVAVS